MKERILFSVFAFGVFNAAVPAVADPAYGTIVNKDGSMIAIYSSGTSSVIARFSKNGQMQGQCVRESTAAWQLRKAYMKASSKWRKGYVPRAWPCHNI